MTQPLLLEDINRSLFPSGKKFAYDSSSKNTTSGAPLRKSQKSTQISPNPKGRPLGRPLGRLILIVFSKNPPSLPTLEDYVSG